MCCLKLLHDVDVKSSRAKLCLVSAFPDIAKDCPKMRNLPEKFWECGPTFLLSDISPARWLWSQIPHPHPPGSRGMTPLLSSGNVDCDLFISNIKSRILWASLEPGKIIGVATGRAYNTKIACDTWVVLLSLCFIPQNENVIFLYIFHASK